ncbi:transposase family protein [Salinispora vitiensis]|uniref:transposase family protein n=2 Tax=Salinispora vitiensis TaxID=999544 RepID=UPI00295A6EC6|nr:transposase family protein [Salinispora vitiensis]
MRALELFGAGATTSVIMELLRQHDSEGPHSLMSSSPIAAIAGPRPTGTTSLTAVTDCERQGLLAALAVVADPRDPRGVRYLLASMLAAAVCAVMGGACTFAAMADWVRDLDPPAWVKLGFTGKLPVPSTLWRLLTRVDDTELSGCVSF